jgi:hypothetical protein
LILICFAPDTIGIALISISFAERLIGLSWSLIVAEEILIDIAAKLCKKVEFQPRQWVGSFRSFLEEVSLGRLDESHPRQRLCRNSTSHSPQASAWGLVHFLCESGNRFNGLPTGRKNMCGFVRLT